MAFAVYMLRCGDGSYYVGHTDDLEQRLDDHVSGAVPGYTTNRMSIELVWTEEYETRYEALVRERQVKGWSRAKKEALIRHDWNRIVELSKGRGASMAPG